MLACNILYQFNIYPVESRFAGLSLTAFNRVKHSTLPAKRDFLQATQVRRSTVSVPSNIAEGKGRGTGKEFIQFLRIALGSLYELQTQLELSMRIGYITTAQLNPIDSLALEVEKMLNSLITSTLRR